MFMFEDIPMLLMLVQEGRISDGLVVANGDLSKSITDFPTSLSKLDYKLVVQKIFGTIEFLKQKHGYGPDVYGLHHILGKVFEADAVFGVDNFDLLVEYIDTYMLSAYRTIFDKDLITLNDIFKLYHIKPVYINQIEPIKKTKLPAKKHRVRKAYRKYK